ncbi:radical SAM mobile pair protein A [Ruminococcus flavefaciens]|jgi:radical SAM mobile pair protein A|uniref:radical SAM mobile pair protein A n=1 Tax=Ruminococcus flavefaciens TaxID=1265 RepID=UPI0025EDCAF2|nr:radical SAM mobile pair protein A [Ruminococcus flavefaciens]MCI5794505.1 radical SAM mobile pair protein A [Ruminococcus sp.]MDD7516145.1 radical SAM mobile pair protein A [Ruminococcus flavefaciens]MDY5692228.1 radical SAM mobile pair protein A [Ruminococcus flavefaciens]
MVVCIKDNIQNLNIVIGCTVGCDYCYARNNVRRWHIIDDFAKPEFFPNKLRLMERQKPQNFLLTGMSDLAGWKDEWLEQVLPTIAKNPQHQFLFLSKRPDLLNIETDLENVWFGVTVTKKSELWRIDSLRENIKAKHYHVTFEPLFDDPDRVDLHGIDWIVVGTMTGAQSKKIHTEPSWAVSLTEQAHALRIPVFMKEDLAPIIGEKNMVQEMPQEFIRVLEEQRKWHK